MGLQIGGSCIVMKGFSIVSMAKTLDWPGLMGCVVVSMMELEGVGSTLLPMQHFGSKKVNLLCSGYIRCPWETQPIYQGCWKMPKQHFIAFFFSIPGEKVLILVESRDRFVP